MWGRKRNRTPDPESTHAIVEADEHLREVAAREEEVQQVTTAFREMRMRNHFAEQLGMIMVGGKK